MFLIPKNNGFTLVEMAVVLTIIAIVVGGLTRPLSARLAAQKYIDTQALLQQSDHALLGYAIINGKLPCPDTSGNGEEEATPCTDLEGFLPWKTLALNKGRDAWGSRIRYRADAQYTDNTITTLTAFIATSSDIVVQDINTAEITPLDGSNSRVAAILYSCGANGIPEKENKLTLTTTNCTDTGSIAAGTLTDSIYTQDGQGSSFDDILIWLPRNVLVKQLVDARLL